MKRIILSVMVLAFAVAVQADDAKTCPDKDKSACCGGKVKTSNEAEASCPVAKSKCCQQAAVKQAAVKQAPVKQTALLSPKAASDAKQ